MKHTFKNTIRCMSYYYELHHYTRFAPLTQCPLPCSEMTVRSEVKNQKNFGLKYLRTSGASSRLFLYFNSERVSTVREVATYTLDNFFSDLGSWLGLLVGMSFLSLVEVATFVCTAVRERFSN